jgi:hypothetical protein
MHPPSASHAPDYIIQDHIVHYCTTYSTRHGPAQTAGALGDSGIPVKGTQQLRRALIVRPGFPDSAQGVEPAQADLCGLPLVDHHVSLRHLIEGCRSQGVRSALPNGLRERLDGVANRTSVFAFDFHGGHKGSSGPAIIDSRCIPPAGISRRQKVTVQNLYARYGLPAIIQQPVQLQLNRVDRPGLGLLEQQEEQIRSTPELAQCDIDGTT